jgi:peptidoglycan/xylan/chitin deacetylase (PgdA/CDA1 family)
MLVLVAGCEQPDSEELVDDVAADEGEGAGKADQPSQFVDCQGRTFSAHGARWQECRIYGQRSALRPGEVVWTIDDGVTTSTADMARVLGEADIPATFFPIARSLARQDANGAWVSDENGRAQLSHITQPAWEHTVGNHTFSHPTGLGTSLSTTAAIDEVVRAHFTLLNAVQFLGASDRYSRVFRSPGNSWSAGRARDLNIANLANYRGPFAWDMPSFGKEDFRCYGNPSDVSDDVPLAQCAKPYVDEFLAQGKGIVLMHDPPPPTNPNPAFPGQERGYSVRLAEVVIAEFRRISAERAAAGQPCIKFVPLQCAIEQDRDDVVCGEGRSCIHE